LLRDMNDIGHPFEEIGIAGYPEGHPVISDERLRQALREKAELATYVVNRMCFSAGPSSIGPEPRVGMVSSSRSGSVFPGPSTPSVSSR
ncbi:MAG: hypothetical protein L0Z49_02505, partial [Actinobacteria bacterium]|nr:hypothetical protein [Actinomycetota bacterium]